MFDEREATNPAAIEVLRILDAGGYTAPSGVWVSVRDLQVAAERGTRLYTPDELQRLRTRPPAQGGEATVGILATTTQAAAMQIARTGSVALLNFASARNPGGGFLGGARAQEEELCRCSGLYRALITQPGYYTANREHRSALYTDHLIYSPNVPFIRVAAESPLLEDPFVASVITTPAPNTGTVAKNSPSELDLVAATFERRWMSVLAVAMDQARRRLILGAWGCGAFRNDPTVAAETAASAIESPLFRGAFDLVVFAIPDVGAQSQKNLAAFRARFAA